MPFGLEFINDAGHTVISSSTLNPVYIGRAAYVDENPIQNPELYPGFVSTYKPLTEFKFSIACNSAPIIFVSVPAGYCFAIEGSEVGAAGTYNIYISTYPRVVPEVYVFGEAANTVAGSSGLAIFKATGAVAFDSNQNHLVLNQVAIATAPPGSPTWPVVEGVGLAVSGHTTTTELLPLPAKPAFALPIHGIARIAGTNGYQYARTCFQLGVAKWSGSTLTQLWGTQRLSPPTDPRGPAWSTCGTRPVMIIDGNRY